MKLGMSRSRKDPDSCVVCGQTVGERVRLDDVEGQCPRCHSQIIKPRPPHMAVLAALQAEYDTQPDQIRGRLAAQARIEEHLA